MSTHAAIELAQSHSMDLVVVGRQEVTAVGGKVKKET